MKKAIKNVVDYLKVDRKMNTGSAVTSSALFAMLLFFSLPALALDAKLTTWAGNVDTALTIVVGIYAVVGGFLVFVQYMQGSQEAQKNLIKFIIGLAIFGVAKLLVTTFSP